MWNLSYSLVEHLWDVCATCSTSDLYLTGISPFAPGGGTKTGGWRSTRMKSGTGFGQRGQAWWPEGRLEQKFRFSLSLQDAGRQGHSPRAGCNIRRSPKEQ